MSDTPWNTSPFVTRPATVEEALDRAEKAEVALEAHERCLPLSTVLQLIDAALDALPKWTGPVPNSDLPDVLTAMHVVDAKRSAIASLRAAIEEAARP